LIQNAVFALSQQQRSEFSITLSRQGACTAKNESTQSAGQGRPRHQGRTRVHNFYIKRFIRLPSAGAKWPQAGVFRDWKMIRRRRCTRARRKCTLSLAGGNNSDRGITRRAKLIPWPPINAARTTQRCTEFDENTFIGKEKNSPRPPSKTCTYNGKHIIIIFLEVERLLRKVPSHDRNRKNNTPKIARCVL
jgi:hypothetical protein